MGTGVADGAATNGGVGSRRAVGVAAGGAVGTGAAVAVGVGCGTGVAVAGAGAWAGAWAGVGTAAPPQAALARTTKASSVTAIIDLIPLVLIISLIRWLLEGRISFRICAIKAGRPLG